MGCSCGVQLRLRLRGGGVGRSRGGRRALVYSGVHTLYVAARLGSQKGMRRPPRPRNHTASGLAQ